MAATYPTTQAVAVRRHADLRSDVVSLARLIAEMRAHHKRLTKDWWIGLWGERSHPVESVDAERQWIKFFGRRVGSIWSWPFRGEDAETLKSAAADVRRFVSTHLTHADEAASAAPTRLLQPSDVHEAIDTIGDLFRRYSSLLTASSYAFLMPVIQHDWMAPFQVPWMRSDGAP